MKLDKDTLIKEHFWFLLSAAFLFVILGLMILLTTASSAIAEQEKKFADQKKSLKGISDSQPKNAEWKKSYEKRFESAEAQEKKIWERAWLDQSSIFTWPENMPKEQLEVLNKLRFYDEIPGNIKSTYTEEANYKKQAHDLYRVVAPTQMAASLRWVGEWVDLPPNNDDIWLSQEDILIQRGLLKVISDTNDKLASLKETKAVNDKQKTFANGNWVLDLALAEVKAKPGLKYTLVNASNRRQVLPASFQIMFGELPYTLEVAGEPLAPGQSIGDAQPLPVQFANARALTSVKQVFDWRTVPVKRVDAVEISHHSSRTGASPLLAPLRYKPEVAPAEAAPASGGVPTPGKGGGSQQDTSLTKNKLVRNRYIERSEQVRRVPVAMAVVIDQNYIQEFLAAVANSPLRIQTTQWHWQRFQDDIKPPDQDPSRTSTPLQPGPVPAPGGAGKGGGAGEMQIAPPSSRPERDEGESGKRPQGARPSQGFAPPPPVSSATTAAAAEEQEWDLVSLAVYGIASLYERYPPPDPNAAAAGAGK